MIDDNPHHLWIEDSLYHRQTINGINLHNVYGHSVEGATGQEALEAVEVRPFVVWDNATLAVAY